MYWPENADTPFVPCPGSPLVIEYNSMVPFAEFVIRKMTVSSVSGLFYVPMNIFVAYAKEKIKRIPTDFRSN